MTKSEVIEKIKKCLRLAASANEHEAAIALRQAQALMEKYQIEDDELLASEAGETEAKSAAKSTPPMWEARLAKRVARGFGCELIFIQGITFGVYSFIGCSPAHEVASYTFDVLKRQCKRDRANYIAKKLKRCTRANATRRADLFCGSWVAAVTDKINSMARTEKNCAAVTKYMEIHYPKVGSIEPTNRNAGRKMQEYDYKDRYHGFNAGKNAELNHGVDTQSNALLT